MDTHILIVCLNAVLPTFLLMATGFVSRQLKLLGDRDVSMMNNLAFKVFMPAMLFCNIYTSDIASAVRPRLLIFAVAGVLAAFALGTVYALLFVRDKRKQSDVHTGHLPLELRHDRAAARLCADGGRGHGAGGGADGGGRAAL